MTFSMKVCLLAAAAVLVTAAQTTSQTEVRFREAMHKEQVEGDLGAAIRIYQSIASAKGDPRLAARALVQLGRCYEKQGSTEARKAYERVLREFPEQGGAAAEARTRLARLNPASQGTGVAARKLTPSLLTYPARTISRDGRYISYTYVRKAGIYLRDLTTGVEREVGGGARLVPPGAVVRLAAISPDGASIAYTQEHADGAAELCIIGVNGTEPRVLQRGLNRFIIADWSRDGSSLLLRESQPTANSNPLRAMVINARTGEMKTVFSPGGRGGALVPAQARFAQYRISPDGRYLAQSIQEPGQQLATGVFVITVEDKNPTKVAGAPADAYVFGWSPDGGQLLYISNQSGSYDLWAVSMRDGRPQGIPVLLRKDIGQTYPTGIADDGTLYHAVISPLSGDVHLGELDIETAAIRNVQRLPHPPGHITDYVSWSPDGSQLLLDRRSSQFAAKAVIHNVQTGHEREARPPEGSYAAEITTDGRSLTPYQTRWTPDGKSVIYLIQRERYKQPDEVVVADVETGKLRSKLRLASPVSHSLPAVAPSGEHMYVARGGDWAQGSNVGSIRLGEGIVVRVDLHTGDEQEVCTARPTVWALSPDGAQIACAVGDTIQIVPAEGGKGRELLRGTEFGPMTWTADGKHLIYAVPARQNGTSFGGPGTYWIIPAGGGKPRKLEYPLANVGFISVHPDNRRVAILSISGGTEIWSLQNVLRSSR